MIQKFEMIRPHTMGISRAATCGSVDEQVLKVVLVDSHKLMLVALQQLVADFQQVESIACFSTIHDVLARADKLEADAVILGISIPVSECLHLVTSLDEVCSPLNSIVIQQFLHPETALTLVKKGVRGLLDSTSSEQDLVNAIRAAASGNTFLCRHAREILDLSMSRSSPHLTERETQVLSLLRYGESNFRMACRLGLREKTVEKYLMHIYRKLNVNSRVEAILYAKELCI